MLGRTLGARGTAPATAGPATVRAATEFERLTELLLDAAPREMLCGGSARRWPRRRGR